MILITGAGGQIGTVLSKALKKKHGVSKVLLTDIRSESLEGQLFEYLDVTDGVRILELVEQYNITEIYHLASILSAKGEAQPLVSWEINMSGLLNVLEVAAKRKIEKVFYPSSIAVFGPKANTSCAAQYGPLMPTTVYGMSKVAGELWCRYYHKNKGVDVRSLRFPGIIGHDSLPGGGTTDYAVEMYHAAVQGKIFDCYIASDEKMPMMYMEDAVNSVLELMEAPKANISVRLSYNVAAMSFSPAELYASIKKLMPNFQMVYNPDFRDGIAKSWPNDLDDSIARSDWNWSHTFNLEKMTKDMLFHLSTQKHP